MGSYCADINGKLVFKEGVLAEAMRNGYWIILDELNLAPTEVLEALNRVLDDNRELFITETQQLIKANPNFLLFATQNPAGHYGGRKLLSRAFRNRFVELHFDTIPSEELEEILHKRCTLPMSYAKRMVGVLVDLQIRRRDSGVFAGKHGFITLRDLFRWGERYNKFAKENDFKFYDWDLHLANDGYMLLAGRVRKPEEAELIKSVLENRFKCKINVNHLFGEISIFSKSEPILPEFNHIVWNDSFRRLGKLLTEAIKYNEPVLLVGETGCGKTSICQLLAAINNKRLYSVNCHMNTESADFLGSLRPVRTFNDTIDDQSSRPLFEWVDGPLVEAMKSGDFFLVDEISLADDSVLERLNSVLESERTLLIAENNNTFDNEISIPVIKAKDSFRYLATMNPGGDYGKKELSPALRNRFTEIWCPPYQDMSDIKPIIIHNLDGRMTEFKDNICQAICDFLQWFLSNVHNSKRVLSIRDILSWIQFINVSTHPDRVIPLPLKEAFINGALLVFVDALGIGSSIRTDKTTVRLECHQLLQKLCAPLNSECKQRNISIDNTKYLSIQPFYVSKGPIVSSSESQYHWKSPTVQTNVLRVMRALNLPKPILLEGMPGVGKTALVQALAKASGHSLIRINLSEQTDISDLFGADLPVEGQNSAGKFCFRDGPLLQALKTDYTWIVLDELNLASQSVLEGLNACLDHRSQVFIPELNKSFKISKTNTRIFATQNPHSDGGARKGLPQSFLNRFTAVFMESFSPDDYLFIISHLFPNIRHSVIKQMIDFNDQVMKQIVADKQFARRGSPWEFNLRELIRWAQVVTDNVSDPDRMRPEKFVKLLYVSKMRTIEDKIKMNYICDKYFDNSSINSDIDIKITDSYLQIGYSLLKRRRNLTSEVKNLNIFESQKEYLEALMKCIEMNWMSILIGESGVGKTSVLQLLSELTGHKLTVFSVNSEMDTMDLLGGFEQKELSHKLVQIEESVFELCANLFKTSSINETVDKIMRLWFEFQSLNIIDSSGNKLVEKLNILEKITEHLSKHNYQNDQNLDEVRLKITNLKTEGHNSLQLNGTFEWRDSILVRAMTSGHWVLIDNANLCSASVLDRLNPLLEPNGELTINEKGCIDGHMTSIRPHPDFRLILSMDPNNGELSRAMRNRGIEINMFAITSKQDFDKQIKSLVKSDDNFVHFLTTFIERYANLNKYLDFAHFNECAKKLVFQIQNGFELNSALTQFASNFEQLADEESDQVTNQRKHKTYNLCMNESIDSNNFIRDAITSTALQDSYLIESVMKSKDNSLNEDFIRQYSASLRIYLENSSQKDIAIRDLISKRYPLCESFDNSSQLMKQIEENIRKSATKFVEYNVLKEFQIDLRYSSNVWNLLLNLNNSMDTNMELIEKNINRYSMNLFWDHLVCHRKQLDALDANSGTSFARIASQLKNNQISENLFPKVFIAIYDIIYEIEEKLIKRSLELCPSNDDFMVLRDILLWFHRLLLVCDQKSSNRELSNHFIVDKFIVLWVLANEKSLSILQSFLNVDLNLTISSVNKMLGINDSGSDSKKQKLLMSLNKNCLIIKDEESAHLMLSFNQLIEDIFKSTRRLEPNPIKDYLLLIAHSLSSMMSGHYNGMHLEKDISYIREKLSNESNIEMADEEVIDLEAIDRRKAVTSIQLEPLALFSLFFSEVKYLNNKNKHWLDRCVQLIESKCVSLNPIHISCITSTFNSNDISSDLILHHLIDFNHYMKIDNILSYLYYDCSQERRTFDSDLLDKSFLWMSSETIPLVSLVCSHLLSDKHNSIGLLNSKISQFSSLKQFLSSNFNLITNSTDNQLRKDRFQLVTNWFSNLVQNICLSSPVKKSSLSVKTDAINQLINRTSNLIRETSDSLDESVVTILVGLITCHLLCPTFPIDPIERNKCKLNHFIMDLNLINAEINARSLLSLIRSVDVSIENSDHTLIQELLKRKAYLEKKIQKYESKSTYRPSAEEYFKMKSDCIQFLNTILDRTSIENFIKRIIDSLKNRSNRKSIKTLLDEMSNLEKSISGFVSRIQSSYPFHNDLTNPFLIGISFVLKGFKDSTFLLKKYDLIVNELNFESVSDWNSTLEIVANFCDTNSPSFIANYLCESQTINKFTKLSNISKTDFEANISSLLRSALLEIQNQISITSLENNDSLLFDSFKILNVFVKCWQKLREEEEAKQSEEEALFEYRTKSHESELSEEERDEKLLRQTFPTYLNHYNVFIDDTNADNSQTIDSIELKSDNDIVSDIIDTHLKIVDPFNTSDKTVPDFRKSYILRHSVITKLIKRLGIFMDSGMDGQLIAGQLIACDEAFRDIERNDMNQSFNIYHNSSLHEINECSKVLESLEKRIITDLLPQFENHPTLTKLLKIIQTIFDLSAKEPLIKLATGLEVLLQAAQDWQLIAHKGISLADNLNEITQLIISWRKLELKSWSQCLDSVNHKIEAKQRNKFWFHLYITTNALVESHSFDDYKHNDIKEFVISIKKFIENSKLGEFKVRINLLRSFMLHVLSISQKPYQNYLFICLNNLYNFYHQFVQNIESCLISVRNPIEKEVKEFVKIARWNDHNFWSVKTAVDKSHKQLIKYIKKYESELNKPIDFYLVINKNEVKPSLPERQSFRHHLDFRLKISAKNFETMPELSDYSLLKRSNNLFTKSKILIKKCVKSSGHLVNQINAIECFTSDLIDGIKELSELQVPNDIKDKTKWKRSAHHIHNRKRRALSDFLKTLTSLGLSYRKGLVVIDEYDLNSIIIITGPLDYCLPNQTQLAYQIKEDMNSCDKYFYKCLARFASLVLTLEMPNKQLSIGTIDRIKGFSTILMKKVIENRKIISQNLFFYHRFTKIERNMNQLMANDFSLIIEGKRFDEHLRSLEDIIVKTLSFNYKSIDLLNSVSACDQNSLLSLSNSCDFEFIEVNATESELMLQSFNHKLNELNAKLKMFDRRDGLYCDKDLVNLKDINHSLKQLMTDLMAFYSHQSLSQFGLNSKLSLLLNESNVLTAEISQSLENYMKTEDNDIIDEGIDSIAKYSSNVLKVVLASIEKVFKIFDKSPEDSEEIEDLLNDSLNSIDMRKVFDEFHIEKALKVVLKLVTLLNMNSKTNPSSFRLKARILKTIHPFIAIYSKLFEYNLTLSMTYLRTTNKLLHILLSLFSDLTQNGFCLPPELSDETDDKDMASELKSVEDGGLGEGQGTKDVSDKIETEDQLEDAFKEGIEKSESKDDERDIEEEENGIEMANDFDGQTFSPSKAENEENENSDEESDNDMEDQMGDVDNNSDVLDEKIWGSDQEDNDSDHSQDEDETGFSGKDSIDNKIVANQENKDLNKDSDETPKPDNESDLEINENELQNDEYVDENVDPFKQNESKEPPKQNFAEDMVLDDKEVDQENDENGEEMDDISVSDQNEDNEEQDIENELSVEDIDLSDRENKEDIEESQTNSEECNDNLKTDENKEDEEGDAENTDNESTDPVIGINKENNSLANNEIKGSDGTDSALDSDKNPIDGSDVNNEQQNTQTEPNEEQHGMNESLAGDTTGHSDGHQMMSSVSLDESDVREEKLKQTNKRDKSRRSLADKYDANVKRQKVIDNDVDSCEPEVNNRKQPNERKVISDLFRHVNNESDANNEVIDIASNEEKLLQNEDIDDKTKDDLNFDDSQTEEMEIEEKNDINERLKSIDGISNNTNNEEKMKNEGKPDIDNEEVMQMEGQNVATLSAQRGFDSSFHTSLDSVDKELTQIMNFDKHFDQFLLKSNEELDLESVIDIWKECESKVSALVYELCERLQLVLEPTKTAKLKGDYRTGKRLNMRKVIAYIASDFRKDKIWLRRTKPSKRQYQIVIAIDDSSSMADNKSKQLAFESLALLGKSLSLLEAGQLAVMSFGQSVRLLHGFDQPFTDQSGANLLTQVSVNLRSNIIVNRTNRSFCS